MKIIKILIKIIVFKLFPHVKNYHERISNIEIAISAVAEYSGNFNDSSALNKQSKRKEIVENILNLYSPKLIVETGTHLGDSTGFFSRFCEKVCTSDLSPIYMWAAKTRLAEFNNIDFFIGDSREFLKKIVVNSELKSQLTFFYLDAHWHEDLPLYEEIKLM